MSCRAMSNRPARLNEVFGKIAIRTRNDERYFSNKEHSSIVDLVLTNGVTM